MRREVTQHTMAHSNRDSYLPPGENDRLGLLMYGLAVGFALLPALVRIMVFPDYPGTDDAFIHLAVIKNIGDGQGWGINPGIPVNLSTSPLFTMAFGLLSRCTDHLLLWCQYLSILWVVLSTLVVFLITRRFTHDTGSALLAAILAAGNIHLWRWTGSFMETTFAYGYVLAIVWVILKNQHHPSQSTRLVDSGAVLIGAMIGLGVLIRPETGLVGVAWALHEVANRQEHLFRRFAFSIIGLCGVLIPYSLWAYSTFGSVLPTTYTAKVNEGLSLFGGKTPSQIVSVLISGWLGSVVILPVWLFWAWHHRKETPHEGSLDLLRRLTILWAIPCLVTVFYLVKTQSLQSAGRYLLPYFSVLSVIAGVLWYHARSATDRRSILTSMIAIGAVALQFAASIVLLNSRVAPVLQRMNTEYVSTMSEAALQLNDRCRPGDTVLVWMDIGVVSLEHDHSCVIADGGALASPELAGLSLPMMIDRIRPRFVLESQGESSSHTAIPGPGSSIVWSRKYLSHSIARPQDVFVARLYELPRRVGSARAGSNAQHGHSNEVPGLQDSVIPQN